MTLAALFLLNLLCFMTPEKKTEIPASIYDFKVEALDGGEIDFAAFRGKKILIVNTASECGYTPQYEGLEQLYQSKRDKLVVVGFPTNDFGGQEPGSNEEIGAFCKRNYGVTFPMAAKISVKGGDMAPVYQWLTEGKRNGYKDSKVKWNFQKFLIDEQGKLVAVFPSATKPDSPELISAIGK